MDRCKILIIHLDRATKRKVNIDKIKKKGFFDIEIINAVDGSKLNTNQISIYYNPEKNIHRPSYPFGLNRSEIGCFLSHRKAWKYIVDNDLENAIIIEDDVIFDHEMLDSASKVLQKYIERYGYIQLPVKKVRSLGDCLISENNFSLYRPTVVPLGACGQMVSKNAAKKLLEITEKIDRPVDTFLQMHWITKVRPVVLYPNILEEISKNLGGSTLSIQRSLPKKIKRTIQRSIYRSKIKALSTKYSKAN